MLILLPGIQAGPPELQRLSAALRLEHQVLPIPALTEASLAAHASALEASLPPGAHDFVAASFGGLLAWGLPASRVRSLITIGSLPFRTAAAERSGRAGRWLPRVPAPLYRALYRSRVRASLREDGADEELVARVELPPQAVLAARLRAIARWDLPPRPPVLATWMWGATDPWVTWSYAEVSSAGHEPQVVPGGHRPHLSHATEVARWIANRR